MRVEDYSNPDALREAGVDTVRVSVNNPDLEDRPNWYSLIEVKVEGMSLGDMYLIFAFWLLMVGVGTLAGYIVGTL